MKSEADKVIAALEESHKKEVEYLLIEIVKLKDIDSKNRSAYYKDLAMMAKDVERQKYKRCLAMALLCFINGKEKQSVYKLKTFFWSRWGNRWWKLAEKFKEAK